MKSVPILLICLTTLLQIQHTLSVFLLRTTCPIPEIPNGRVKYRSKGRVARFRCNDTYILMGTKIVTCISGSWNKPLPLCIKPNCPALPKPRNGHFKVTYRGAVTTLTCNQGFSLHGSRTIFCIDYKWNDTLPSCEATDGGSKTSCDFETDDLCGWTQDQNHNFDWSRQNQTTPSGYIGTGPSFDHTLGKGFYGHYMYIESSSRLENDTARLLSPVYQPQLSQQACFVFWYHMYGATTGTLKVSIKLITDDINNMTTVFSKSGEQGDRWYGAVIHLAPVDQPFQVVIEGIRGRSYASDIAIDDVNLSSGDDCQIVTVAPTELFIQTTLVTSSTPTAEPGTVAQRTARPFPTYLPPPPPPTLPPIPTILTTMTSPAPPYQYTTPSNTQHNNSTESRNSRTTSSVDSQEFSSDNTEIAYTVQHSEYPVVEMSPSLTSPDIIVPTHTASSDIKTNISFPSSSTRSTTRTSTTQATKTTTLKPSPTTSTNVTVPTTAPAEGARVPVPNTNRQWTRTTASLLTSSIIKAPAPSSHMKGVAIISAAVAIVAILAVVVIFIAARRRISLKRRNDMAEDSDVRYLTSEEVLDFNLARPTEDDL